MAQGAVCIADWLDGVCKSSRLASGEAVHFAGSAFVEVSSFVKIAMRCGVGMPG